MAESLAGVSVLYNTYWIRFGHGKQTHDLAVANTRSLIRAAQMAGVGRIVHISITNPDPASDLPYFRGKALLEEDVRTSGISYAIVRPTVIFGKEDILINNIAFLLRKAPVFLAPGDGRYRLQPVFAEDVAAIAVGAAHATGDLVMDAVGPEIFSFDELLSLIARTVGSRTIRVHAPSRIALLAARMLGTVLGDVLLTADELAGLMTNLLISNSPPTGSTLLSSWLMENAATVGTSYSSELQRHFAA